MKQGPPEILGDSPQFLRYEGMKAGFGGQALELLKGGAWFMWGSQGRMGFSYFYPVESDCCLSSWWRSGWDEAWEGMPKLGTLFR